MNPFFGLLTFFAATVAFAGPSDPASIRKLVDARLDTLEPFYQDLHRHPELSGKETQTAAKMAAELRKLGFEVQEKIGGTGVVAVMKNGAGPTTLVRAELDALPVTEATGLAFKSENAGVMHACGHDLHLTSLLGTAWTLTQLKSSWRGTLVLLVQPAEETISGARAMIQDGLLKKIPKPDTLLALHTGGIYPQGTINYSTSDAMASSDSLDVRFIGKGTHGSMPSRGIDPFTMAAEFVLRVQTLTGREVDSLKPAVVSVGSIHGGTKHNIIPDDVKLQLTVRAFDPEVRARLLRRIHEIADGIAMASGAPKPELAHPESTGPVYNDTKLAGRMGEVFKRALGADRVVVRPPIMGSEDFSEFAPVTKAPSFYFFVGTQTEKDAPMNHSPRYAPSFRPVAETGIIAMTSAVLDLNGGTAPASVR